MLMKNSDGASVKLPSKAGYKMKKNGLEDETLPEKDEWDEKTDPNPDPEWWKNEEPPVACTYSSVVSCEECGCPDCQEALAIGTVVARVHLAALGVGQPS